MGLKKFLEGRWFGHPLHPFIVHLPMGLWLMGVGLDLYSYFGGQSWPLYGAAWCLLIGTATAVLAAITGLNDWLDIRDDHPAQKTALWHMGMMVPATVIFAVSTLLHFLNRGEAQVTGVMVGLSCAGYALCMVGGYLGGILVYDEGIAVGRHRRRDELPQHTLRQPRKGTTEVPLAPATGLPAEFRAVVPESAIPPGHTMRAELAGTVVMIARTEAGKVCAVQEFCTHRCGPLSEGRIEGEQVRCPWHNSCFDLETGKVAEGPAKVDLKTFPVRIHEGIIHVRVPGETEDVTAEERAGFPPATGERRNPAEEAAAREKARQAPGRRTPAE